MEVIVKGQSSVEIGFETKVVDSYKSLDSALSETSKNPVTNAAITAEIRRQDSAIEGMSEANETFKGEVSLSMESFKSSIEEGNDAFKEEVNAEIAKKANKSGYSPALTSGFSDHLVGHGESVPAEFSFRASGGKSILDGTARVKELRGNAVVWNQLIKNGTFADLSYWSNGISSMVTTVEDGVATMTFEGTTSNGYNQDIRQSVAIYANHKYFFAVDVYSDDINQCHIILYTATGSRTVIHTMQLGQWNHASGITTMVAAASGSSLFRLGTLEKIGQVTMKFKNVSFYDLTLMFGAGNEPTTVEEFYQRLPVGVDHSEYNVGELIPFNADAIKSIGDNAWDEEWEVGAYNSSDGNKIESPNRIRSKNFIPVLSNTVYYSNKNLQLYFYDSNYNFISWISRGNVTTFTTPNNCRYVTFNEQANTGTTYNNDIIISLVHSGWKAEVDGGYKPYWDFVRKIDPRIKEAFPEGMRSAGAVHDRVYNKNGKGVIEKRIGVVDLGSLKWEMISNAAAQNGAFLTRIPTSQMIGTQPGYVANIFSAKYIPTSTLWDNEEIDDRAIYARQYTSLGYVKVVIRDSSYTDATSFKAAMAGVMLWYELAEAEIIEYDEPFNLDYEVADFGTEEIISEQPSAPINANIAYGFNAVDQIRNNADEIAQLKATIAQLQEAMASMVDNNVEE